MVVPTDQQPAPSGRALGAHRDRIVARLKERGTYRRWVLVTALVGMFSTTFPVTLLTVSLGDIADDFDVSDTLMTWVIAAPFLASAVALPILGKMGDLHGQRRVFLLGFVASTAVAGLTAFAWSALALIALRTLSQVIGSATQPTAMALILRAYPAEERVKALGWWSLVTAGAPAVGLIVGGPLVDAIGWRFVFVLQAGLSVIPVVVAALVLEEVPTGHQGARFDFQGAASMALAAGTLVFALNQSPDWGWNHPVIIACIVVFPGAAALFVRTERRVTSPLLPPELLVHRNFTAPLIAQFFAGATYMGGFVITPFLMRDVLGWSTGSVALLMVLRPLTYSLSSPVGGRIGSVIGERRGALLGNCVLAGSMAIFAVAASAEAVGLIGLALVVQGVGNGVARPSLGAIVANAVDESDIGIASASQRMFHQVGNAFGIAVLTAIYGGVNTPSSFTTTYLAALGLGAICVVATSRVADSMTPGSTPPGSTPTG